MRGVVGAARAAGEVLRLRLAAATAGPRGLPALAVGRRGRWLVRLIAAGLLRSSAAVLIVLALRGVVDRQAAGQSMPLGTTAALLGAMALAVAVTALLRWRETIDAEALAQHYIAQVRSRLFRRLGALSPQQAQRRSRGGVLLRFVGDAQALRGWVGQGVARLATASATLAVLWIALLGMAPGAAAMVAAAWAACALIAWRGLPALRGATAQARRRQAQMAASVCDRIATLPVWQLAGRQEAERRRLLRQSRRLRRALRCRAEQRGRLRALVQLAAGGTAVIVLAHAAVWLQTGGLGTALAAAALGGLMAGPLREVGRAVEAWSAAQVARQRVLEFLGPPVADGRADPRPPGRGAEGEPAVDGPRRPRPAAQRGRRPALALWDVAVHGGRLGPLSAQVARGRRVALLGAHGSGKSTLLAVAAGLIVPDQGTVWLGETALRDLPAAERRRRVALVAPELGVLRGSVLKNLRGHDPRAPASAVEAAVLASGLHELWADWPRGAATRVRDGGVNLSHGARRAVQLARALAGRPALLLIDDAQASLPGDPRETLAALIASFPGTLVFATVAPALAELADEVWRIEGGRLVDETARTATASQRSPAVAGQRGERDADLRPACAH